VVRVFAACVFPVFSWSVLWFLQNVFGWLPYLNVWNTLSIFAYTQAFALLESSLIVLLLIGVAAVLPARSFRDRFTAQASTAVFVLTFWTVLFQLVFDPVMRTWSSAEFVLWFGLALVSVILACVLAHRSSRIETVVIAIAERLTIFLYFYVPLGLMGLIVVIERNVL
jgi:hypothetical protein